jgi:flavin reductase (DIM6/NTAB) family NADH-FMN oxidoreductase RutF
MSDDLTEKVDYPLYIVTASSGEEMSGCLAGFVTQSSIKPVRFIVCISRVNHTYGVADRGTALGLHLLGSDQRDLAMLFGEASGDSIAKFEEVAWSKGATGVPILTECAAWVEGPILSRMSAGDHEAFLIAARDGGRGGHAGQFMKDRASDFEPGHPA